MDYIPSCRDASDRRYAWDALERFAERVAAKPALPPLLPCEFGYFGCIDQPDMSRIYEFRHHESRRWLQITAAGKVARYVPPTDLDRDDDCYELTGESLRTVVRRLELHEFAGQLPLEHYCDGFCRPLVERRGPTLLDRAG